jgi:hypothetical protein
MKTYSVWLIFFIIFAAFAVSAEDEKAISVTDIAIHPAAAFAGDSLLISCRVTHVDGQEAIRKVAALVTISQWNITFPELYDNGQKGDAQANDSIYSLTIQVPEVVGEGKVVFSVTDLQNREIESDAVSFVVQ